MAALQADAVPLPMSAWRGALDDADAAADLAADAERLFGARTGCTFWRALDAAPQCGLEAVAVAVARFHVAQLALRDIAGVEWWVQSRSTDGSDGGGSVLLHYDKDESAYSRLGVVKYPTLSTATYLRADAGSAPLVVFDPQFAAVASPVVGKHVAFDGSRLHGVPAELGPLFSDHVAAGRRVSLLANLWTREPCGAHALDAAEATQLGLSPDAPAPALVRAPVCFDDGRGARKVRLSDAAHETPPLPLAGRGDRARAKRHVAGARDGFLVFRFC